ncbi:hypothetical protein CAPTEDRAFT_210787 [Capitella teleta]|uniref:Uncharacterized protein n=1 Tax=Capitella teleta TaxID=283909 RepID=R7TF14_CAPTE|nr:hypothetical protein CAPTEDRAFT_210787 [Capitella teleta]|eukprot:ELT92324.1 hypothetical protein CAPTEDRAFT_210787 [Capitella teleta]
MGICEDERKRMRKVELERRVQEVGRMSWEQQLQRNERTRRYAQEKGEMKLEQYADGQDGAGVRLMMRGGCLPVRMNECVRWKYGEDERRCTCGEEETERHVLFECVLYERLREEWLRRWREERGEEDLVEGVLGLYLLEIEDINKEKLERQIVTVPKQRHFNPINLNLKLGCDLSLLGPPLAQIIGRVRPQYTYSGLLRSQARSKLIYDFFTNLVGVFKAHEYMTLLYSKCESTKLAAHVLNINVCFEFSLPVLLLDFYQHYHSSLFPVDVYIINA